MNLLRRLTIPVFKPGAVVTIETTPEAEQKAVYQLLGCVLSQCMVDRMSSLSCGLSANGEGFMVYASTGLAGMPAGAGRWSRPRLG